MLGRMRVTFGDPRHVVLGVGDWEQRQHCKFKEPTKGKGLRETLRRGGYKVLLVDEFRTTKQCAQCQAGGARCETFLHMPDPREKRASGEHLSTVIGCANSVKGGGRAAATPLQHLHGQTRIIC